MRRIHLIGERDAAISGSILNSYLAQLQHFDKVQSQIAQGTDHTCYWAGLGWAGL